MHWANRLRGCFWSIPSGRQAVCCRFVPGMFDKNWPLKIVQWMLKNILTTVGQFFYNKNNRIVTAFLFLHKKEGAFHQSHDSADIAF
jgi:hypothetical protein